VDKTVGAALLGEWIYPGAPFDHRRQAVGRNDSQSRQSWFSSPGEQKRAYELRKAADREDRDEACGFARSPNLYAYAGGRTNYIIM
jgi:hypothetical protein